ncbi:MAG: hypothetical protein WD471_01640 [Candidatus Paceibacterota bacterium]
MAKPTQPTQSFIEIEEIRDGVIYMKNGELRKVLMVNGINFDLKSEEEQKIILASFQRFLNTLDFSVQFFIHSRKVNIKPYTEKVKERENEEMNQLLKTQISEYIEFITSFVAENPIITKTFFIVVPYSSKDANLKNAKNSFMNFLKKDKDSKDNKERLEDSLQQLSYRENEVTSGLNGIGLRVKPLEDDEITELFYNLYNPGLTEKQGSEIPKISK